MDPYGSEIYRYADDSASAKVGVLCQRDDAIDSVGGKELACRSISPLTPGDIAADHDDPGTRMDLCRRHADAAPGKLT
jgi:hypothetical protein